MTKTILQVLLIAAVSGAVWAGLQLYFSSIRNVAKHKEKQTLGNQKE